MQFKIRQKEFVEALQKAYPIVPLKSSLHVLTNFRFSFFPDHLSIMATDLDHSIMVTIPIEGDGSYDITVNAKKISEIARELPGEDLIIKIDENIIIIESGSNFTCRISGTDTRDYPSFPDIQGNISVTLPVSKLKSLVNKSSFAVAKDESRACLCGVYWEIDSGKTSMVSTDGHRLGYSSIIYEGQDVNEKISCIVSPKTLQHAVKIFEIESNDKETVTADISEKYVVFKNEFITLCTKLLDGPYPDYEKVIPKNNSKKCVIQRSVLIDAVRRVSVLSNQKTHLMKFMFNSNTLEVSVLNRDIGGEARQILDVEYSDDNHIIGFNSMYLSEILNIISSDTITFEMGTQISACLLIPEKGENSDSDDIFLIMPLKIIDDI